MKVMYKVTLGGFDYDFEDGVEAISFMEQAIRHFSPDKWHDEIRASMEVIVEKPEEIEEIEEGDDD